MISRGRILVLFTVVSVLFISVISCSEADYIVDSDATLSIICPSDTIVPIDLSTPEEIGVYPTVVSDCPQNYLVTSRDSIPEGFSGGLIRIWEVTDGCGNSASCNQSIGLGAPAFQ